MSGNGRKRANGEGSISRRTDGRWEVRVQDKTTGKRRTAYARSKSEATQLLRTMIAKADAGENVLDAGSTLDVALDAWLANRAGKRRSEATVRAYEYRLRQYVCPTLGGIRLRELTVVHVEDLLDRLSSQGLSPWTVKSCRNALAAMLRDLVRERRLTVNVANLAQLPEAVNEGQRTTAIPTDDQVRALVHAVRGTDLAPLVAVVAGTGARIGEVLGMRWADVDLDGGVWTVTRTITRNRSGGVVLGSRTKTGATRKVALADGVIRALQTQSRAVAQARLKSAHWVDLDLAFPTSIGTPREPNNVRRELKSYAVQAGFPGSFHGLRHWYASLAISREPLAVVSKILEHARVSTTSDIYGHLRDDDAARVAGVVGDRLEALGE